MGKGWHGCSHFPLQGTQKVRARRKRARAAAARDRHKSRDKEAKRPRHEEPEADPGVRVEEATQARAPKARET